ncbi:Zn2-C6 fungal-type domain-containing protein [Fusarium acuminatum]|uniref:Zn2-C6 fungal-type domain-containing protein n=1 Tax=Fusarium acuminatum TaxID=5515 RepID=A0ABZ2X6F8_9HYPO
MIKRRSACERCRNQKLKCIREHESSTDACLRCSQTQEECVVSLRKTPGRPPGRGNSSSRRSPTNNTPIQTPTPTPTPTLVLDDSDSVSATRNGSCTSSSEDALESLLEMNIDWSDMNMFPSAGPLDGNEGIPEFPSSLFNYSETTRVEPPPPCTSWSASGDSAAPTGLFPYQIPNQNCDPGIQLSGLQQNLSKHLIQLRSLSWDITSVLKLESASYSLQGSESWNRAFNPLVATFEIISEFEHVLATLRSAINRRERQEASTLPREMNISYSNPAVKSFILDSTPGIYLSGFVIPSPKNVLGRSFAQLMQLKISPVETALGLPDDCRISKGPSKDQRSDRPLLMSGKEGHALLAVLKDHHVAGGNSTSTMGVLESLRAKIAEIERLE